MNNCNINSLAYLDHRLKDCYSLKVMQKQYLIDFRNRIYCLLPKELKNLGESPRDQTDYAFDLLRKRGFLKGYEYKPTAITEYLPTVGTFYMSSVCNLQCIYCYAANNDSNMLDFKQAKIAVDYLVSNAITKKEKKITIKFHGAGEPTLNWSNLVKIFQYTKSIAHAEGIDIKFKITTNGVLSNKCRHWLAKHMSFITLSLDGTEEFQNTQRPHKLLNSFHEVIKTINIIKHYDTDYAIRATVTNYSVSNLPLFTKFLSRMGVSLANYEPVWRFNHNKEVEIANSTDFLEKYKEAKGIGRSGGIAISYSRVRIEKSRDYHCGACGSNFVVTPNGLISLCYAVFNRNSPFANLFLIGDSNSEKVNIDYDKLEYLNTIVIANQIECNNCFAVSFCGGGCLIQKLYQNKAAINSVKIRCEITKGVILEEIRNAIKNYPSYNYNKNYSF
jgi:uncharacterized protein